MTSRTRYAWAGIIAAMLVVAGWVVSTRASPIRPLERLPGGIIVGPTVGTITDTSAVIALKTAAPAFCQVNYGSTPQYGQMRRMSPGRGRKPSGRSRSTCAAGRLRGC